MLLHSRLHGLPSLARPRAPGAFPFPPRSRTSATPTISRSRSSRLACRAFALPEAVDATIRNAISISAVVGISYAVLLAAVSEPPPPPTALPPGSNQQKALKPGAPQPPAPARSPASGGDDNFVWGLMGFITFLPLFNWMSWVLAALSDEDRAVLYGTYAALYGTPLLLRGLDWQDPWVLFMLALCAVHVQAERIAQTEPETLRSVRPVGLLGAALRGAVGGTGAFLSGLGGVLAGDARRVAKRHGRSRLEDRGPERPSLGPGEDPRFDPRRDSEPDLFVRDEMRRFDEELKLAEAARQQQKGKEKRLGRGDDK
ncbi:hypothetical protein HYH03_006598 [Edaphochlamys debaryana]|uniref:Uncharacterized protein n=1 Tax=Edaphochlamys debaryana TaxID=47281 RepID=A0A836C182_9CHLO|nr:hypothetical protein HYH03_006598 [Edaphochlamys debaryana]|eukprot:KAG2495328.1 hypothetical protein HYH03_006598 [Edaphochlamys debaryana]